MDKELTELEGKKWINNNKEIGVKIDSINNIVKEFTGILDEFIV